MKRIVRLALVLVVAAGGSVGSVAIASQASAIGFCSTVVSYDTAAIWVKETSVDCYGQRSRAILYYLMSRNGSTTYMTTGPWRGSNIESMASTSSSRYFAGTGYEFGA